MAHRWFSRTLPYPYPPPPMTEERARSIFGLAADTPLTLEVVELHNQLAVDRARREGSGIQDVIAARHCLDRVVIANTPQTCSTEDGSGDPIDQARQILGIPDGVPLTDEIVHRYADTAFELAAEDPGRVAELRATLFALHEYLEAPVAVSPTDVSISSPGTTAVVVYPVPRTEPGLAL